MELVMTKQFTVTINGQKRTINGPDDATQEQADQIAAQADNKTKPVTMNAVESLGAAGTGVAKGLALAPAPPGGVSLSQADPKGPVATWAQSRQPQHPQAEDLGRNVGENIPPLMAVAPFGMAAAGPLAGAAGTAVRTAAPFVARHPFGTMGGVAALAEVAKRLGLW
jgi:hypothetical protein